MGGRGPRRDEPPRVQRGVGEGAVLVGSRAPRALNRSHDHVHVAVSLVREDGTKASIWRDRVRMSELCAESERRLGNFTLMQIR